MQENNDGVESFITYEAREMIEEKRKSREGKREKIRKEIIFKKKVRKLEDGGGFSQRNTFSNLNAKYLTEKRAVKFINK